MSSSESIELNTLRRACFMYMLLTNDSRNQHVQCDFLLSFLSNIFPVVVCQSQYMYLDVLDQNADI